MRARDIKPGFYKNDQLAECSMPARLLFPGLWMLADRAGRLEYRPKRIKAEIFPFDDLDIVSLVDELEAQGLVKRYEVSGERYLYIPKFLRHQKPHSNEKASNLPPCEQGLSTKVESAFDQGTKHLLPRYEALRPSSLTPSSLPPEGKAFEEPSLRSGSSCRDSGESDEESSDEKLSGEEKPKSRKPKKAKPEPAFAEDSEAYRLAVFMRDTLKANVPTLKEPDLQKWAQEFDKALRNDERMGEARFVAQVVKWACSDGFWRANIQSPGKLREKFDQLTAKMETEAAKARASPPGGAWKSPAQRRLEANQQAGREAKRLLFGDQEREAGYATS